MNQQTTNQESPPVDGTQLQVIRSVAASKEEAGRGGKAMHDKPFAELMAGINDAGHIARGEAAPARTFTVACEPLDVTGIREGYRLS